MPDASLDELRELTEHALADGLRDTQRGRWRELVADLLGRTPSRDERRKMLRAPAGLDVHVLEPDDLMGLVTSTVGAGGISLPMQQPPPVGTPLALSIKVPQRKVPLFVRAQVIWTRAGEIGAVFTDVLQGDRELLEAIAVRSLLAPGGMMPP
jgi:PilZ domain-containing protein